MDDIVQKYLLDIKESVLFIETYLGNKRDLKTYLSNKML